jgi:hypothetical protein
VERHFYWVRLGDMPQWLIETPTRSSREAFDEPWMFIKGRVLPDLGRLKAQIAHPGTQRAFVFSAIEEAPLVSEAVANVFKKLAPDDVQLLPVSIEGEPERYFVVNATKVVDAIDEARCREVQHDDEDDPSPEYPGEYRWIYGLRIDPSKVGDAHVFRLKKFKIAFVVSEDIKSALDGIGNLGVSFEQVTSSDGGRHGE